ncbi:MAG: succinyl-diaminopimelate desuccinylase [Alphaproteobacteria bacterium]|nr:succinyl-diaminopimelate desuccinylase [Alphaproteobacteria bacterium]
METQDRDRLADPLPLALNLIRCRSVTPHDAGAMAVLERALEALGFTCTRLPFDEGGARIENLYARRGTSGPNFCFAGHTDVVPPGDESLWQHPPFEARIADGMLFGRGAADMKSAIAAFVAAVARLDRAGGSQGSISLLITGDEEGPAVDGTVRVLAWLEGRGERIDHCIVGEPTSVFSAGDTVKNGRRGSLTGYLTVSGVQGHVGYPERARNPIPGMAAVLTRLSSRRLDEGTEAFQPSNLEVTTVDTGNPATNVIPAEVRATFNIRFNTQQTSEGLEAWIREETERGLEPHGLKGTLRFVRGAQPFLTPKSGFTALLSEAIEGVTGSKPDFSTTGGTSDARFIHRHCPVAEIGLAGTTMHKTDECVRLSDIEQITQIYEAILRHYFASQGRLA